MILGLTWAFLSSAVKSAVEVTDFAVILEASGCWGLWVSGFGSWEVLNLRRSRV